MPLGEVDCDDLRPAALPASDGREGTPTPRQFRPHLGRRLLVALLVAGVLPVMIVGYRTRQEQEGTLRVEALKHAQQTAKMLTGVVGRFADALQDEMRVIAGAPDLRAAVPPGDWAAAQRALEIHALLHPRLRGTALVDAGGLVRARAGGHRHAAPTGESQAPAPHGAPRGRRPQGAGDIRPRPGRVGMGRGRVPCLAEGRHALARQGAEAIACDFVACVPKPIGPQQFGGLLHGILGGAGHRRMRPFP